jgi:hypothetical protein
MGYNTRYTLNWDLSKSDTTWEEISEEIGLRKAINRRFFYGVDTNGNTYDACKWYDHENDIAEFSKIFPDVIFELSGEGEEARDIWKKYFKNGKIQICIAKITFDEFDESKLTYNINCRA